jgi:hypothetical protein
VIAGSAPSDRDLTWPGGQVVPSTFPPQMSSQPLGNSSWRELERASTAPRDETNGQSC